MAKQVSKKKRKKKSARGGIVVVLIGGAVAAGYFLRDCMPNWGLGGGGAGEQSADANNPPVETQPVGERGTVSVVVKGEQCTLGERTLPCAEACAAIKADKVAAETRIEIDSTAGAHAVVEAFTTCLSEAGYAVDVASPP